MDYDFELDRVRKEIKKRNAKKVLVQLPEGLKQYSKHILDELGVICEPVLSADACYGACDVQVLPGFDLTVHFGHSEFISQNTKGLKNVIYVNCKSNLDIKPVVEKAIPKLGKRVGIITTAQHVHKVDEVRKLLEKAGKKVFVGKSKTHASKEGQILGCDVNAALEVEGNVDSYLYIGSGRFHPLGLKSNKLIIQANPYSEKVNVIKPGETDKEMWIRKEKAHKAKDIAIVISSKPGQHFSDVDNLKKRIENGGKKSYVVSMDEITPEKLDYLPYDAFVITACPRIVLDDWKNYKKPVLLPNEL